MIQQVSTEEQEFCRIHKLSEFDLQYQEMAEEFGQITDLAATIAGTEISFLNLIDNYNQWSISATEFRNIPREDSICSVTIQSEADHMEVNGLHLDERFQSKEYVKREDGFRYYFGVPLQLESGEKIGALCVLDRGEKSISEKQRRFLKLLAEEIVGKLEMKRKIHELEYALITAEKSRNQIAHDVRGPVFGISGLADTLRDEEVTGEEMREYLDMISKSANGIIEMTDDILNREARHHLLNAHLLNIQELRNKILELYRLPAGAKELSLNVQLSGEHQQVTFSRRKLLSIIGNLVSNAIKFTSEGGEINVNLEILQKEACYFLQILVSDSGDGISEEGLQKINDLEPGTSLGTDGERGFGLGLPLVKQMVAERNGEFHISAGNIKGTKVAIQIPIK